MDEKKKDEFYELCQKKLESVQLTVVGRDDVSFTSKVYFMDDDKMEFTMKRIKGEFPNVRSKDKLDVKGFLSDGKQLLFYVKAKQIRISDDAREASIIETEWPDNFAKKQMRQDVRVRAALKCYFAEHLNDNRKIDPEEQSVGVLQDISRGGCFVLSRDKIVYKGRNIFLYLYIQDSEGVIETILPGKVVIVKSVGKDKEAKCQGMAVSFTNISKNTEDRLMNWIFEQQRLQLAERREKKKA